MSLWLRGSSATDRLRQAVARVVRHVPADLLQVEEHRSLSVDGTNPHKTRIGCPQPSASQHLCKSGIRREYSST